MKIQFYSITGSEVKGRKREETQTQTQNQTVKVKTKYKNGDAHVTNSNFAKRQRCVAIPKGEKRVLRLKVYFEPATEDIVKNAILTFVSYKTLKAVSCDVIKTELKEEILPLHIKVAEFF